MTQNKKKETFIRLLAQYLVGERAKHLIGLHSGRQESERWARLSLALPSLEGCTVEEAEERLRKFLSEGEER